MYLCYSVSLSRFRSKLDFLQILKLLTLYSVHVCMSACVYNNVLDIHFCVVYEGVG